MSKVFISIKADGSLSFKALLSIKESDEVTERTVRGKISVGTDAFGLTFAELKHYAETQHYFDYKEESRQAASYKIRLVPRTLG